MYEIKINAPDVVYEPAKVVYDFTELDSRISEIEKRYKAWLPSEDEIKDAEKVAKEINGVATDLNAEKVRIKKEINSESKQFEDEVMKRVNNLKGIRQSVLDSLDVYEQERIKTRIEEFKKYVEDYCKEIGFEVPYDVVLENRITNKSCTEKQWKEIAKKSIDDHKLNYDLLANIDVKDKALLQTIYKQKWDRMLALDEYNSYMDAKKCSEQMLKQEEDPCDNVAENASPSSTYMISITGPSDLVESFIERMRSSGIKVEVL